MGDMADFLMEQMGIDGKPPWVGAKISRGVKCCRCGTVCAWRREQGRWRLADLATGEIHTCPAAEEGE